MSRSGVPQGQAPRSRFERPDVSAALVVPSASPADQTPPDWLAAGTTVSLGDTLAVTGAAIPSVRAPAAGTVGSPRPVRLADGREVHAVEFLPQSTDTAGRRESSASAIAGKLSSISPEQLSHWIDHLRLAGLWVDRWTCPDLLGQFHAVLRRPVDRVVLNVLDSDPWLSLNGAAVASYPVEVAAGVGLLARLTGAAQSWALVDQADPADRLAGLRDAAKELAPGLRIAPIENDYPQPDPSLVVYATTRRRLKPGRLPTDQGVLLVDAAAAAAIGHELAGRPYSGRVPVVIYDQPRDVLRLMEAPIGMSVAELMALADVPISVREIYAGSPLRQLRVRPDDVVGGGEATFFAAPPQPVLASDPCVRCGWCIEGCPTRCRPAGLLEAAQREDLDLARHHGLDACIECGLCTYVCPSRLPLLQGIRRLRVLGKTMR